MKLKLLTPKIEPKSTKNDDVRTNQLRKISGEWLEYKKYEATDDIRRIVWKVFAKNKELIVRKQEDSVSLCHSH